MKKNVLMISLDSSMLDRKTNTYQRMQQYAQQLDQLTIIVLSTQRMKPLQDKQLQIYATGSRSRWHYYLDAFDIVRKNDLLKETAVITAQDPYDTGLLAYILKRAHQECLLNIQEHMDFLSPYWKSESILNFLRYYIGCFVIKKADTIRAVSMRIKKSLINTLQIDPVRIHVVPVYTDRTLYTYVPKKRSTTFVFLMISRLVKQKNIPLALRAFKQVARKHTQARLLIIGAGRSAQQVRALRAKYGLEHHVILKPWASRPATKYAAADALLLSSNYEGWARTCVESLLCGRPVIMTDVGCAGEIVIHERNGLIVPINSETKMTQAMLRYIEDSILRQNLIKNTKAIRTSTVVQRSLMVKQYIDSLGLKL